MQTKSLKGTSKKYVDEMEQRISDLEDKLEEVDH